MSSNTCQPLSADEQRELDRILAMPDCNQKAFAQLRFNVAHPGSIKCPPAPKENGWEKLLTALRSNMNQPTAPIKLPFGGR